MTHRRYSEISLSQSELDALLGLAIDPFNLNASRAIELLAIGANPDAKPVNRSQHALCLMAECSHPDSLLVLNALLERGANPNGSALITGLYRPLHAAVTAPHDDENSLAKISALINAGADPNALDQQSYSPVKRLCQIVMPPAFNALHALRLRHLVSLGADIATPPHPQGISVFVNAATRSKQTTVNIELLRELVSLGVYWDDTILNQSLLRCRVSCHHYERIDELELLVRSLQDQRALELSTPRSLMEPARRL